MAKKTLKEKLGVTQELLKKDVKKKCAVCGKKFDMSYIAKNHTTIEVKATGNEDGFGVHRWICPNCGQEYVEECKEEITLSCNGNGNGK